MSHFYWIDWQYFLLIYSKDSTTARRVVHGTITAIHVDGWQAANDDSNLEGYKRYINIIWWIKGTGTIQGNEKIHQCQLSPPSSHQPNLKVSASIQFCWWDASIGKINSDTDADFTTVHYSQYHQFSRGKTYSTCPCLVALNTTCTMYAYVCRTCTKHCNFTQVWSHTTCRMS